MANDSERPSPSNDASPDRRSRGSQATGILWLFLGVGILFVLLVFWLLPVPSWMNPIEWVNAMLGKAPANPPYDRVMVSSTNGLIMWSGPSSFATVLPATLGLLVLASLAGTLQVQRRRAAGLVLGHLSSAVQLGLPLPLYLRMAAKGEAKMPRRRLLRMATLLERGESVGEAIAVSAGELPPLVIDRIAAAERSSGLSNALEPILDRERRRIADTLPSIPSRAYVSVVLTTMVIVTWMLLIFVMPKFAQIFADFRIDLPPITKALISNFPVAISTVLALTMGFTIIVLLTRVTRGLFTSRPGPDLFGWLTDPIVWYTPIFGRLTRNRHCAAMCDALAEALLVGRPLPNAIGTATLPALNGVLRRKMQRWQQRVADGQPFAAAARSAGMPTLLCDLLAGTSVSDGTDAAGAVIFAAKAYGGASNRLIAVLSAVAPVVITGVLAVFVAFLALAMFTPMISLIDGMTGANYR